MLPHSAGELFKSFESLGEACDFGTVQRAAGLEPFGLFRFAGCTAADMVRLLGAQLEPLGSAEDFQFRSDMQVGREYIVSSRNTSYESHTGVTATSENLAAAQQQQLRKLRFLKARLLTDLREATKIFVWRGPFDARLANEMQANLRRYGDNSLLWISKGTELNPPGSLKRLGGGLMRGFVGWYGKYASEMPVHLPLNDWFEVCSSACSFWRRSGRLGPRAEQILLPQALAQMSCIATSSAETTIVGTHFADGGPVFEHHIATPASRWSFNIEVPAHNRPRFDVLAEVFIPRQFSPKLVEMNGYGAHDVGHHSLDMGLRDRWQVARVTGNRLGLDRTIRFSLEVGGAALRDRFYSRAWRLEAQPATMHTQTSGPAACV